jgi:hypothetical protein
MFKLKITKKISEVYKISTRKLFNQLFLVIRNNRKKIMKIKHITLF